MNKELYNLIVNKEHHKFRKNIKENLCKEYSKNNYSPIERMTKRFTFMCMHENPIILENENIVFTRTSINIPDIFTSKEWNDIKSKNYIHELGYISNLSPNYYKAIELGLLKLREECDEYGKQAIDNIINLSDKYLAKAKEMNRLDIVETLSQVPKYPAKTFKQALQFFRILHFSLWLECNYHNTVGRFDKYMYKYLESDLNNGIITEETALDLLEEFFLSFNKDSDLYPGVQQGDNGQSLMLGGIDSQGNYIFNKLSELSLKASYNNKLIDPKINLRVNNNTPEEIYTLASNLTKAGLGFPQYSNDDIVIPALQKLGYSLEDASNYTVAACWEFIIPFVGRDIANIDALSFAKVVQTVFYDKLNDCDTFEELLKEVECEILNQCNNICNKIKNVWFVPSPFLNCLMDCDIYAKGKYNNFGIHGTGIATATDSLYAIKKYIYDKKEITKKDYVDAVKYNFNNNNVLLHKLRYETEKLGNNNEEVDNLCVTLLDYFSNALKNKKNCLGGIYRAGTGTAMYYLWHVNELDASPDGRLKGEPLGANFSISLFANVKGPISVISSMTKPHFLNLINGGPLTLEFYKSMFNDQESVKKVGNIVRFFIQRGGHQLQLNAVDINQLKDAQINPEKHKHLVVRIWGWSAYFVELDKEFQDHVIARQVYNL